MVLEEIVARTRRDVADRIKRRPLDSFRGDLRPSDRSLLKQLRHPRCGFILECKKASPSQGLIRPDFDPLAIAQSYAPFANAISVLTDAPFFQGSHEYLRQVRDHVAVPILCKDFVVDPYQIYEARGYGADAILLMCSVLDQPNLLKLLELSRELSMDALVEVHDREELTRATSARADIIGINNRNLATLEIDLGTTEALAPHIPQGAVTVCESGISSHHDIRRLRPWVDAFLIGTHMMRQANIDHAVRETIFGRVKICGLTRNDDAQMAYEAGAVYGGLVFWPQSSRAVDIERAATIKRGIALKWVGVFVDAPHEQLADTAQNLSLDVLQLHGSEDRAYIAELRTRVPAACEIWKAKRMGGEGGLSIPTSEQLGCDRILLDAYRRDLPGGTGEPFDWDVVRAHPERAEVILSGGLSPDNAAEADDLGCRGLDLSSGIEQSPGIKDRKQLEAFFNRLQGHGRTAEGVA